MTLALASDLFRAKDYAAALAVLEGIEGPVARFNAGQACIELGRYQDAINYFDELSKTYQNDHRVWMKLGAAALMAQDHELATSALERAISMEPKCAETQHAYASLMATFILDMSAIEHYRAAQELREGYTEAALGEAFCLLRRGRYEEGWKKFESRWGLIDKDRHYHGIPQWDGENVGRLIVRSEQGHGDTIQFSRYLPLIAERGIEVIVEVHPLMRRLVLSIPGVADTFNVGEHPPVSDAQCIIMSLPRIFGTTLETIPPPVAPDVGVTWRSVPETGFNVGLCWAGGERKTDVKANAVDQRRSIPFALMEPLLDVPVKWFSLQKERGEDHPKLSSLIDSMEDWYDTAELVNGLDIIVTVDTAVAHLAATLGKPVLMLNRYDTCWRWGLWKIDTPWYPTLRILRQLKLGDWSYPIQQAANDLRAMLVRGRVG